MELIGSIEQRLNNNHEISIIALIMRYNQDFLRI